MHRRVRHRFCALLLGICGVSPVAAQTRPAAWNDIVQMVMASPVQESADADLLRSTAAELAILSPTFRQMLEALKGAPHVNLRARPVAGRRSLGRGHFSVGGAFTTGVMEISVFRRDPHLQVRALAHELAHAVEIACLPPQVNTPALHQRLLDRAGRDGLMRGHGIETPFARAGERLVLKEYLGHGGVNGQLSDLATVYELPLCQDGHDPAVPLRAALSQPVR